jgi:hypothetical protein
LIDKLTSFANSIFYIPLYFAFLRLIAWLRYPNLPLREIAWE